MKLFKGCCPHCNLIQDYGGGCATCGGSLDAIRKVKNPLSFNTQTREIIKLLSNNPLKARPFGSFVYSAQFFPSDIDITEQIIKCCDINDGAKKMVTLFKRIAKETDGTDIYFSEAKAGNDERFNINIDDPNFNNKIIDLFENKLLSKEETESILKLNKSKDPNDKEIINETIRMKNIIRWSKGDIINGYKILAGNKKISLFDAMKTKGHLKIDVWAYLNNRYIEVTNFWILNIKNKAGETIYENFGPLDYEHEMKKQIKKLGSKLFYNPFKMAKRMWGLSRAYQNYKYLELLTPLFQGNIARLNQIASEIDTLILMVKNLNILPAENMIRQIDEFKMRIAYIYDFNLDEEMIFKVLTLIIDNFIYMKKEDLINHLTKVYKYLKTVIYRETEIYLKKNKLLPIPQYFK